MNFSEVHCTGRRRLIATPVAIAVPWSVVTGVKSLLGF